MEIEEVEATLEKIWDLHDKLSDAIHSISKTHFINSTKSLKNPHFNCNNNVDDNNNNGFVFMKDSSAIFEAKSLNSIRSALENLEDQLEFFHVQQRAERDAALARLEQCRLVLALRLAEHHGKKYKVIDEAINFVGDASCFIHPSAPTEHSTQQSRVRSNLLVRILLSGFNTAKKTLQPDKMGAVLGNAAVFALSMLALLQLQQVTYKDNQLLNIGLKQGRTGKTSTRVDSTSFSGSHLDVRLARG
ncbi:plastid division protein PDV1-like isoform X2 [Silene latifolia]|uniref:plastid division protein PDV1-like isoform X2 n=1 Tax=Silene latifolia TaxID=37657 RepID=UPI003D77F2AD